MGSIELILAKLFDSFKAKNPMWAAIIIAVLTGFMVALQGFDFFGEKTQVILEWVIFALAALTGSRTYGSLKKADEKKL